MGSFYYRDPIVLGPSDCRRLPLMALREPKAPELSNICLLSFSGSRYRLQHISFGRGIVLSGYLDPRSMSHNGLLDFF